MNIWGVTEDFLKCLRDGFARFLDKALEDNPLKSEYFLPNVVGKLIEEKKARVSVLETSDKWFGVTYKEDKDLVVNALREKRAKADYPDNLWEDA